MAEEGGETEPLVETPTEETAPAEEATPAADDAAEEATPAADDAPAEKSDAPVVKEELYTGTCHFPDWVFTIGWLCSIVIVVVLAKTYGIPTIENMAAYVDDIEAAELEAHKDTINVLYIPLLTIGFCAAACICWIVIMLLCGKALMWMFLIAIIGASGFGAFYLYTNDQATLAMPFALLCMFMVMYSCSVANNIAFASTTLQIATHVILEYFSLIFMSLVVVALSAAYLIIWIVALLGLYVYLNQSDDDETDGFWATLGVYFTMLVFFFWTAAVLQNIVVVTTVGVVSQWWCGGGGMLAVPLSFCRATTWNLGAICFGSLIIAIITALDYTCQFLAKQAKESGNKVAEYALIVLDCIIKCLKTCMEYLTEYAFCFVGIYGHSFMYAGYEVIKLIGGDMAFILTNDSLVATVVLIGKMMVAGVGAYVSNYYVLHKSWANGIPDAESNLTVMGGAIGWSISGVIFGLITAGNKSALILWKDKPEYLKDTHPAFYEELDYIWTSCMGKHKAMEAIHAGDEGEKAEDGDEEEKA